MKSYELFDYIKRESKLSNSKISRCIGITQSELSGWHRGEFVPSYNQMISLVHFAKVLGIDYPKLKIREYFEESLKITYKDFYRIDGGIDYSKNRIHISAQNGLEGYCYFEDIRKDAKKPLLME